MLMSHLKYKKKHIKSIKWSFAEMNPLFKQHGKIRHSEFLSPDHFMCSHWKLEKW